MMTTTSSSRKVYVFDFNSSINLCPVMLEVRREFETKVRRVNEL